MIGRGNRADIDDLFARAEYREIIDILVAEMESRIVNPEQATRDLSKGIEAVGRLLEKGELTVTDAATQATVFAIVREQLPTPETYPVELFAHIPRVWTFEVATGIIEQIRDPSKLNAAVMSLMAGAGDRDPEYILTRLADRLDTQSIEAVFKRGVSLWGPETILSNLRRIKDGEATRTALSVVVREGQEDMQWSDILEQYGNIMEPEDYAVVFERASRNMSEDEIVSHLSKVGDDSRLNTAVEKLMQVGNKAKPFRLLYAFMDRLHVDTLALVVASTPPAHDMRDMIISRVTARKQQGRPEESDAERAAVVCRAVERIVNGWGTQRPEYLKMVLPTTDPYFSLSLAQSCLEVAGKVKKVEMRDWLIQAVRKGATVLPLEDQARLLMDMYEREMVPVEVVLDMLDSWSRKLSELPEDERTDAECETRDLLIERAMTLGERGEPILRHKVIEATQAGPDLGSVWDMTEEEHRAAIDATIRLSEGPSRDTTLLALLERPLGGSYMESFVLTDSIGDAGIRLQAKERVIEQWSRSDAEAALSTARLAQDTYLRASLLLGVLRGLDAGSELAQDLVFELKSALIGIQNPADRAWRYVQSAEVMFQVNPDLAIETMEHGVSLARSLQDSPENAWVIEWTVGVLLRCDAGWALDVVLTMPSGHERDLMLQDAAQNLAEQDRERALEAAHSASDEYSQAIILEKVVDVLKERDLDGAVKIARSIRQVDIRDRTLLSLVNQMAMEDATRAFGLAKEIISDHLMREAFLVTVESALENDPDEGRRLLLQVLSTCRSSSGLARSSEALVSLVEFVKDTDFDAAFQLCSVIPDEAQREEETAALIGVLGEQDLDRALTLLEEVSSDGGKARALNALLDVASRDPASVTRDQFMKLLRAAEAIDDDSTRTDTISHFVSVFAAEDFEWMVGVTGLIQEQDRSESAALDLAAAHADDVPADVARMLSALRLDTPKRTQVTADVLAKLSREDLEKALEIAREIGGRAETAARAAIAVSLAPTDINRALEVLRLTDTTDRDGRDIKDRAMLELVRVLGSVNPEHATRLALEMMEGDLRDRALAQLAAMVATGSASQAALIAEQIRSEPSRSQAMLAVVESMKYSDTERALKLALTIQEQDTRVLALMGLYDTVRSKDPTAASRILYRVVSAAQGMKNERDRYALMTRAVVFMLERDTDKAVELCESIKEDYYKSAALLKVVEFLTSRDTSKALMLIDRIKERDMYLKAVECVATALAERDSRASLELIKRVRNDESRMKVLGSILHILTADELPSILDMMAEVHNVRYKAFLFRGLVRLARGASESIAQSTLRHLVEAAAALYQSPDSIPEELILEEPAPFPWGQVLNAVKTLFEDTDRTAWLIFQVMRLPIDHILELEWSALSVSCLLACMQRAGGECQSWLLTALHVLARSTLQLHETLTLVGLMANRCADSCNLVRLAQSVVSAIKR
ncbi:MAG: hypothetical protein HXY34_03275 [Candidatus Thorarchaeota archaeon]|nr:hypothetical protein [Candidatus Thorarchaeota archaeon]